MPGALQLQTERLTLRPLVPEDFDAILAYHGLEEVARYQYWSPRTRESLTVELPKWIASDGSDAAEGKLGLGVVRKTDNRLIGDVYLGITDVEARQAEVGYSFNPQFQGQGYATEAVRALLDHAFDTVGLHRVLGRCDVRNTASWKLLERLGLRREAHFREHALFKGHWDEEFHYAILEDEWRHNRGQAA